jgi:hypothetical protein
VISGIRFVESLDLSLSGRYTDYDSYGSNETYKIGLNWAIASWMKIRASDGTSFRAPALYELYLANQTSFLGQTSVDPCIRYEDSSNEFIRANCAAAGIPATGRTIRAARGLHNRHRRTPAAARVQPWAVHIEATGASSRARASGPITSSGVSSTAGEAQGQHATLPVQSISQGP